MHSDLNRGKIADFYAQLEASKKHDGALNCIIRMRFDDVVRVEKSSTYSDRCGTDYWVYFADDGCISVDLKICNIGPGNRVPCETVQMFGRVNSIGWSLDARKETDYVIWYFPHNGRWFCASFPQLLDAMVVNRDDWTRFARAQMQTRRGIDCDFWIDNNRAEKDGNIVRAEFLCISPNILRKCVQDWTQGILK